MVKLIFNLLLFTSLTMIACESLPELVIYGKAYAISPLPPYPNLAFFTPLDLHKPNQKTYVKAFYDSKDRLYLTEYWDSTSVTDSVRYFYDDKNLVRREFYKGSILSHYELYFYVKVTQGGFLTFDEKRLASMSDYNPNGILLYKASFVYNEKANNNLVKIAYSATEGSVFPLPYSDILMLYNDKHLLDTCEYHKGEDIYLKESFSYNEKNQLIKKSLMYSNGQIEEVLFLYEKDKMINMELKVLEEGVSIPFSDPNLSGDASDAISPKVNKDATTA